MKKSKKYISLILVGMLLLLQIIPVYAEEDSENEWYEMVEEEYEVVDDDIDDAIVPYTQYIVNVLTSIAKISSSKIGLRADVYCASTVQSATIVFYLQKKSGSSWVNVSSGTASATNFSSTAKQMTVSGVSSGTYRAKTVTTVRDSKGYSESVTCYSGSISI